MEGEKLITAILTQAVEDAKYTGTNKKKLKQGFGRLIRHQDDLGICILADSRILNKSYGQIILDSLPVEHINYNSSSIIVNEIDKFLGK